MTGRFLRFLTLFFSHHITEVNPLTEMFREYKIIIL